LGCNELDSSAAIKILENPLDSDDYLDILKKKVRIIEVPKDGWQIFQHHNWAIHTKKYFDKQHFKTIDWPYNSP
jgi:hypothetical protein